MSDSKPSGVDSRRRRRWRFADCIFDEANWSLSVGGQRVTVETKPLEILRALLIDAGNLVTKDELLDRVWPDVTVVEASLPTAVHKLRIAINDERRLPRVIETVPRIGYRLGVPAHVEETNVATLESPLAATDVHSDVEPLPQAIVPRRSWVSSTRLLSISAGMTLAGLIVTLVVGLSDRIHASRPNPAYTQREARNALRRLDVRAIEGMLAAGWDPDKPFDAEGNGAINYVLNQCEWDHGHNQEQILLMVRTLTDSGAVIDRRNVWGDTPYSIAKAERYCGPEHPVTKYLRMLCTEGKVPLGDRCLASYELARRSRGARVATNARLRPKTVAR